MGTDPIMEEQRTVDKQADDIVQVQIGCREGETNSDTTAPPGFPNPIYLTHVNLHTDNNIAVNNDSQPTEVAMLGKEGAHIWQKHFAPQ